MNPMKIYNTLTQQKEDFKPIEPGRVRMYVCGLTTYDYAHIGHARMLVAFDVVVRYLRAAGYQVTYVRNITDIDDKIIRRANENGEAFDALTERFIRYTHEDEAALGIVRPDIEPRATGYIEQIIAMNQTLIANGSAYAADNGDVYFSVPGFANYARLSRKNPDELLAGARIEVDEKRITRIGASVTGRVVETSVDIGYRVKPGEVLARISSTELTQAQLNYLRSNASFSLSERALERAQQLYKADVISAAELQRRESEQSIAKAELRAASDQLTLLGFDQAMQRRLRESGQLDPTVGVIATRGGVIVERKVSQGQVAQPGDALFTVADLTTVWAVGALPEQAAASVQMGQVVDVLVPALGEKRFRGRIVFVSDTIQPETRTITVRTEVDNASRELKPQMLASMRLFGEREERLAIPDSAVVRDADRDHVFLHRQDGSFKLLPVELGPSINGQRPVIRGLQEGQPIVMRGAFHLNNERKRAELE
ncbi:MAG: hypothetical protein RLZZ613_1330 [Pseudomonadota bacterium]